MKKHSLTLLMAMGGPKSQNPEGQSDSSETAPDQSGDAMAPGSQDASDDTEMDSGASGMDDDGSCMIPLPKGFKPPASASDGGLFTTTLRGMIVDGKDGQKMLDVQALGDMPLKGGMDDGAAPMEDEDDSAAPADQDPDQSQQPALSDEGAAYVKRKKDADAAKKAFQPNR